MSSSPILNMPYSNPNFFNLELISAQKIQFKVTDLLSIIQKLENSKKYFQTEGEIESSKHSISELNFENALEEQVLKWFVC